MLAIDSSILLQSFLEITNDVVYLYDLVHKKIINISSSVTDVLGYTEEEAKAWTKEEQDKLLHPHDRATRDALLEELVVSTDDRVVESILRLKDVHEKWLSFNIRIKVIDRNEKGNPILILYSCHYLTDNLKRETLLEHIINGSGNGVLVFTPVRTNKGEVEDFSLNLVNKYAAEIIGISIKEAYGRRMLQLRPQIKETNLFEQCVKVLETGIPAEGDFFYKVDNDKKEWYKTSVMKFDDSLIFELEKVTQRKKVEYEFLSSCSEIERKQKELELKNVGLEKALLMQNKELQKQSILLENVLNKARNAFIVMSPVYKGDEVVDFKYEIVNDVAAKFVGKSQEYLKGKTMHEVYDAPSLKVKLKQFKEVLLTGRAYEEEYRSHNSDFEGEWLHVRVERIQDKLMIDYEIQTARKEAEFQLLNSYTEAERQQKEFELKKTSLEEALTKRNKELQEQGEFLKNIFDNAYNGYVVLTPKVSEKGEVYDFEIKVVNPKALKSIGLPLNEVVGKGMIELFPGVKENNLFNDFVQVLETGKVLEREIQYNHGKFKDTWYCQKVIPFNDCLLLSFEDVTTRKRAERELLNSYNFLERRQKRLELKNSSLEEMLVKRTQELQEREEDFRSLIQASSYMVWQYYPDYPEYSAVWYNATQKPEESITVDNWQNFIHQEDLQYVLELWEKAQQQKEKVEASYRLKQKNGDYRFVNTIAVPMLDENGAIRKWIGTVTDVHEKVIAEKRLKINNYELNVRNKEQRKVNQILQNFVFIIAHDLRSPVINIKLVNDLIAKSDSVEEKLSYLPHISKSINKLDQTIEGLVEIIQIQSESKIAKQVNLDYVMKQIRMELSDELESCHCQLITDFNKLKTINYVEPFLRSIIKNLLTNSMKYADENKELVVEVMAKRDRDFIMLQVKDNGSGMDLEQIGGNLFRPFKRFSEKGGGTGVGMYIIKSIVEKNGGIVKVSSKPGVGTTFTCYLKEYEVED